MCGNKLTWFLLIDIYRLLSKSLEDAQKAQEVVLTKMKTEIALSRNEKKSSDDETVHLLRRMLKEQSLSKADLLQAMSSVIRDITQPKIPAFVGKLFALRTLLFDGNSPRLACHLMEEKFLDSRFHKNAIIFSRCPSLQINSSDRSLCKKCCNRFQHCAIHKDCSWCS